MPAKSRAQQRLMQAAEHGAKFPMAQKIRSSMTPSAIHDFTVGPMKNKPGHVAAMQSHPNASRLGKYLHPKRGK